MTSDILNALNKNQRDAARAIRGPSLILAGAGSGKTRVLAHRVAHMIADRKIPSSRILMCTFTNKAAGEMKERVRHLIDTHAELKQEQQPYAGTFHSLCARVLRSEGGKIGILPNFVIYDTSDQLAAVKTVMNSLDISQRTAHPHAVLHTISEIKNELLSPSEYIAVARGPFQESVSRVYRAYQDLLWESGALDFDDLLFQTVVLLRKNPDIAGKYQERFSYILIDEYQDTNKAQYELSLILAKRHRNICVVGDASQSIYKWRGADFRNIVNFKKDFPEAKEFSLEQNYRSTQRVLDAAHAVISHNTSHPILTLWTENGPGDKITLYEARNEHDEATFLIQTILQSGMPLSDTCVLYRTNAQSRVLEEAFLHAGVPYILVGGTRFYERKEIKDVLSYLRVLANPKDSVSLRRIQKLGKKRLQAFNSCRENLTNDRPLIGYSTLELLDTVLEKTGYLLLYDSANEEDAYRLENIKELRSVATEFPDLNDFLENVALVEQEYDSDRNNVYSDSRNAVTLMTMHAAKGLEFSIVFIVGMEEGLFPHSRSMLDKDELEEERRLCYVAITRAKKKVYLTHANRRLFFGTRTENMASRFIADIPEELIDFQASLSLSRGFNADDLLI